MIGAAWVRNSAKERPVLVPMSRPTGFPSIVPVDPMFVASTLMRTNLTGLSLSVSQTWKTRARTKTMEVTSSTRLARMPDMSASVATKRLPVM